eukprot:UN01315
MKETGFDHTYNKYKKAIINRTQLKTRLQILQESFSVFWNKDITPEVLPQLVENIKNERNIQTMTVMKQNIKTVLRHLRKKNGRMIARTLLDSYWTATSTMNYR